MLPEPDHGKVRIGIRWHTGATDELRVARAVHTGTARRSPSPAVEMVRQLGPVMPAAELAGQLNAAGLATGNGRPFDAKAVQWIRHAYNIPVPAPYADGEISVTEAARRLGCSTGVIYDWIQAGQLDARRGPGNRLCIPWNDRIQAACHDRIAASRAPQPARAPGPAADAPEMSAPPSRLPARCSPGQHDRITPYSSRPRGAGTPHTRQPVGMLMPAIRQHGHRQPGWRPATSVDSDHTRITGHRRNPDGDEVPEVRRRL